MQTCVDLLYFHFHCLYLPASLLWTLVLILHPLCMAPCSKPKETGKKKWKLLLTCVPCGKGLQPMSTRTLHCCFDSCCCCFFFLYGSFERLSRERNMKEIILKICLNSRGFEFTRTPEMYNSVWLSENAYRSTLRSLILFTSQEWRGG